MKCWLFFPLTYLAVAFLTFALHFENYQMTKAELQYGSPSRELGSIGAGALWPIYWSAKGALYAVRYAKATPITVTCRDAAGNSWKPSAEGFCVVPAAR